jgi:hypothetical protein
MGTTDERVYITAASPGIERSEKETGEGKKRGYKLLTIYDRTSFEMPKNR